jgi:CheY-like chemotaxis protein
MIRLLKSSFAAMFAAIVLVEAALAQSHADGTEDPVVRALLAANPNTPTELLRTARILLDLGQPALAQPLVKRLAEKKLDDEALAELVDEFGSAVLLRLARVRELNPAAGQFCMVALAGAQRYARDPARLASLAKRLKRATPHEHATVVAALRPGGDASVAALAAVLADPARADEHGPIGDALIELGAVAGAPLAALLGSNDSRLVAQVLDILGQIGDPAVVDHLLAPALAPDGPREVAAAGRRALAAYFSRFPSTEQAAARLQHRIRQSLETVRQPDAEPPGVVQEPATAWRWDDDKKQLVGQRVPPLIAELLAAVDFATDARRLLPDSPAIRRLYHATLAQAVAFADREPSAAGARFDGARALVARASVDDLRELLGFALQDDQPAAAAVAVRQLGETEDPNLLHIHSPQASELARAVPHPDRGLRFAALAAIMKLAPRAPYPGAGRVAESLDFFARSSGTPRALVAAASAAEVGRIAGLLAALGYEPDVATDAAGVLRLARTAGDYEVIFVDSALAMPSSGQLLQRLRSDSRTARIPLAIISLADEYPAVERVARRLPLCVAVMRVHDVAGMQFELARLLQAAGRTIVGRDERRDQGIKAVEWIGALAGKRQQIYDLRRLDAAVIASLDAPGMTTAAIATLAKIDTPHAQRALVDLASRLAARLADRQAAAKAFAASVAANGTLLTSEEILAQYDRYNASETQTKDTQRLLANILDTIEARAQADSLALERPTPAAK